MTRRGYLVLRFGGATDSFCQKELFSIQPLKSTDSTRQDEWTKAFWSTEKRWDYCTDEPLKRISRIYFCKRTKNCVFIVQHSISILVSIFSCKAIVGSRREAAHGLICDHPALIQAGIIYAYMSISSRLAFYRRWLHSWIIKSSTDTEGMHLLLARWNTLISHQDMDLSIIRGPSPASLSPGLISTVQPATHPRVRSIPTFAERMDPRARVWPVNSSFAVEVLYDKSSEVSWSQFDVRQRWILQLFVPRKIHGVPSDSGSPTLTAWYIRCFRSHKFPQRR